MTLNDLIVGVACFLAGGIVGAGTMARIIHNLADNCPGCGSPSYVKCERCGTRFMPGDESDL